MKLLIIGASGMIGSRIVAEATSRGHHVVAASRNPDRIASGPGVEPVALNVYDSADLKAAATGVDAVVSTVSPRNSGNAEQESVDYADALIAGVNGTRLIMVGGAGTLNLPDGTPVADIVPEMYAAEARGMRAAFERIAASALDYTVLAPAAEIAPGDRTGQFRLGDRTLLSDDEGNSRISAEDYAVALIDELERPAHRKAVFSVAY